MEPVSGHDRAAGGDAFEDADGDEHGDEHGDDRSSWAWVSWLLVAACLVPALLLAEVARRVLSGDYDAQFFGTSSGAASTLGETFFQPDVSMSQRFTVLWVLLDLPGPLLGSAVAALAAAGIVLVGRPGWLVPDRRGARIAACGLWLGAFETAAALVGLLQVVGGDGIVAGRPWLQLSRYGAPEGFAEVAPALAVLVPVLLVTGIAGVLVWRGGAEPAPGAHPAPAEEGARTEDATQDAADDGAEDGTDAAGPVRARAIDVPVAPPAAPAPGTFPTVPDTERRLYRRP